MPDHVISRVEEEHPLMYVLGDTQEKRFPLILTIGREPNYDATLNDKIGKIDIAEFSSMSGGVWITAYTQFAKQYIGLNSSASDLKKICFEKKRVPNSFHKCIPYWNFS